MDNNNPADRLNHVNFMNQLCYVVDVTINKVGNDYFKALVETRDMPCKLSLEQKIIKTTCL